MLSMLCCAPNAYAQDVVVAPLRWSDPENAPQTLPILRSGFKPEFPEEFLKTPDIGYVFLRLIADKDGKPLGRMMEGTHPRFAKAVQNENIFRVSPGRRDGQAVMTDTLLLVIFNPASASLKTPDATPRLLNANWVVDPRRKRKAGEDSLPTEIIWARVSVDESGRSLVVKDAPDGFQTLLQENVLTWQFAPARRGGLPVTGEILIPFMVTDGERVVAADYKPPKIIRQGAAFYPHSLIDSGLRGEVIVDYTVDIEGRVTRAFVAKSLNPAFDESALAAVRKWKFEPATSKGVPIPERRLADIRFGRQDVRDGGDDGFVSDGDVDQTKLAPEFRYDTPARITASRMPVYPYALMKGKKKGVAKAGFVIGPNGKIIRAQIAAADTPEMGEALLAALDHFEFIPAVKDGRPTQTLMSFEHKFDPGIDRMVSREDKALIALEEKHPERIVNASKLDVPLKPITIRPPLFPSSLMSTLDKGEAVIEFLIDKDGHPRLPRIAEATEPAFGYAAIQVIGSWRFEPPLLKGKPVVARVQVPFNFKLRDPVKEAGDQ